jgi:hypothetical protein
MTGHPEASDRVVIRIDLDHVTTRDGVEIDRYGDSGGVVALCQSIILVNVNVSIDEICYC